MYVYIYFPLSISIILYFSADKMAPVVQKDGIAWGEERAYADIHSKRKGKMHTVSFQMRSLQPALPPHAPASPIFRTKDPGE